MPSWTLFAVATAGLALAFVALARSSASTVRAALAAAADSDRPTHPAMGLLESDRLLAANVAVSHGLLLGLSVAVVWLTAVPSGALGVERPTGPSLLLGVGLGTALAVGNEASARLAERLGFSRDERLRALLTPSDPVGWVILIGGLLPLVALAEELLFRGLMVGGLAAGFEWPVVALVLVSSAAFGLGHGLQGTAGIVVTTGLGVALASAFVLTGSLVVVAVAHYVVNLLEFLFHRTTTRSDPGR